MFDDRIEVVSPGGLPSGITAGEYLSGKLSVLRNRNLANVFYRLGFVEIFGTGITRIKQLYAEGLMKPDFEVSENAIKIVLPLFEKDANLPEEVADKMKALLTAYNAKGEKTFEDILDFHVKFERIHPFQDGNGRVGRLIMFKECLKYNIVPFIIEDSLKLYYYRGLKEWNNEKGYLTDTCLTAQDKYKAYLDYFRIAY